MAVVPKRAYQDLEKKDRILSVAYSDGYKYGIISGVAAGIATLLATRFSPRFAKYMSLSAKISLPVMATTFGGVVKFELTMHGLQRDAELEKFAPVPTFISKMPFHHKALNYLFDHPFQFIATIGIPFISIILNQQLKQPNLKLSQRIMHSRVFGQAGILSIALTTMAFRSYMHKHGRFLEPGEVYVDDEDE